MFVFLFLQKFRKLLFRIFAKILEEIVAQINKLLEKYLDDILADFGENTVCAYLKNISHLMTRDLAKTFVFYKFFSPAAHIFAKISAFLKMFGKNISFRQKRNVWTIFY